MSATLGTLLLRAQLPNGVYSTLIRAFGDSGSQVNLITEDCVQRIGLRRVQSSCLLSGIGATSVANGVVTMTLVHRLTENPRLTIKALVVPRIASSLPDHSFVMPFADELPLEVLADPQHNVPGRVDMLLGAGVWANILNSQIKRKLINGSASLAQSTSFGWVVYGQMPICSHLRVANCQVISDQLDASLDRLLLSFWSADDMHPQRMWTKEEQRAEDVFITTHKRDARGRYIVQIPRKSDAPPLGNSRAAAKACFLSLERKLIKNPKLHTRYRAVFQDYRAKQHLVLANESPVPECDSYYMQHHAINTGPEKKNGKFRVVFNASAPSSNGVSFNDQQLPGPKLIDNIGEFFIRFRMRKYAITADISQMYRQVRVNPIEWNFQRVFYRDHPSEPLLEYVYTVVTWGMASASFNAVRSLRQCAIDGRKQFPAGAEIVLSDFYVDDLLTGGDTQQELREAYHQVTDLLRSGGFELSKWITNDTALAMEISQRQNVELVFPIESGVLGMKWIPSSDVLTIDFDDNATNVPEHTLTKRKVISITSQIYDPSGLVAPVIVVGKILQQNIWRSGIGWDDLIPDYMLVQWRAYRRSVESLNEIRIPRWVRLAPDCKFQFHIFTDASEQAMGAVIYLRCVDLKHQVSVSLITAKAKVTPVKRVTIPRLELTAARLGAKLFQYTRMACRLDKVNAYFWTDSTIAVHWMKRDPSVCKPFVANRVIEIKQLCEGANWRHVEGVLNPADLLTRGISATQLNGENLWWHGPPWLTLPEETWPQPIVTTLSPSVLDAIQAETILERGERIIQSKSKSGKMVAMIINKSIKPIAILSADGKMESLLERSSELSKLVRATAYVFRFIANVRRAVKVSKELELIGHLGRDPTQLITVEDTPNISSVERRKALDYWIKITQFTYFEKELKCCRAKQNVPIGSSIIKLTPFVDEKDILRVGGRLVNADLPHESKHQIILPPMSRLTNLIVRDAHAVTIHGQAQLMMTHLRRSFWFTRMRQVLKSYVHRCPKCIRYDQPENIQLMGNLPAVRVNIAEPFAHTGVDFAGPFVIRKNPGRPPSVRGKAPEIMLKAWIVLFVCMTTRAAHLEICIGLTVEEFMTAFERFVMRKGRCFHMMSDNGTTFVGANNELARVLAHWTNTMPEDFLAKYNTKWHFITPAAPFKGGIWEACVKSMKRHLKRAIGKQILTKDDLNQLAIQIEGCLNSRPLWPQSDDLSDLSAITPAHFVLGKPILPQPLAEDVAETPANRLTVWQQRQHLHQSIWKRWREEYLMTLQQRTKWYKIKANLKTGDMVVIRDEDTPPSNWVLGRVSKVHVAADGLVRTATIKTATSVFERPINKLCILLPPEQIVDHPIKGGEDVQD